VLTFPRFLVADEETYSSSWQPGEIELAFLPLRCRTGSGERHFSVWSSENIGYLWVPDYMPYSGDGGLVLHILVCDMNDDDDDDDDDDGGGGATEKSGHGSSHSFPMTQRARSLSPASASRSYVSRWQVKEQLSN
jgi:hypothetical protein